MRLVHASFERGLEVLFGLVLQGMNCDSCRTHGARSWLKRPQFLDAGFRSAAGFDCSFQGQLGVSQKTHSYSIVVHTGHEAITEEAVMKISEFTSLTFCSQIEEEVVERLAWSLRSTEKLMS